MAEESMDLPPGFRFHPTDEEIITHYLSLKVLNQSFTSRAMGEVDLNKCEPWDLPSKANMGEKEWYFFCHKDRKYPTGMRTNRATEAGYWKATGKDKEIFRGRGILVGMKKTLVFYRGRAPKGVKSNWVMHEFRLEGKFPKPTKEEWVVSRVFHKSSGLKKSPMGTLARANSFGDEQKESPTLPPLTDTANNSILRPGSSFSDNEYKWNSNFSNMMVMEEPQVIAPNNYSNLSYPIQPVGLQGQANIGYLHQEQAMLRALVATTTTIAGASFDPRSQCKAEQPSNSIVSQETGVSSDRNTEISSVVSKSDVLGSRAYDNIDLENLWKY